jgi:predicted NUDIX family phosphoesterase
MAQVFVVERADFFGGTWAQGFVPMPGRIGDEFLERAFAVGRFVERELAEQTPAWKQWIPYCILRCSGRSSGGTIEGLFAVRRSKGQSEARLHGLYSLGLGGHVEPQDHEATATASASPGGDFFARSLVRELTEELHIEADAAACARFVGILNDDSTAVGSVHAGLVYVLDLPLGLAEAQQTVQVREISKMSGGFGSLVEFRILWQDRATFETWSQLLVDAGVALPMGTLTSHPDGGHSQDP